MKKTAVLLLVAMLSMLMSSAFAKTFDMSSFTQASEVYDIDVDANNGVAFIETTYSASDLAFTHKYESDYYWSTIESDILVIDYFKTSRYPILRTWITYSADKPLYINAVSFIIEGTKYTLTDVADSERITKDTNGYQEKLLIKFGSKNTDFFAAFAANALISSTQYLEGDPISSEVRMILHGTEDIEVIVPGKCMVDFSLLAWNLINSDALGYLLDTSGTPCKVTTLQ